MLRPGRIGRMDEEDMARPQCWLTEDDVTGALHLLATRPVLLINTSPCSSRSRLGCGFNPRRMALRLRRLGSSSRRGRPRICASRNRILRSFASVPRLSLDLMKDFRPVLPRRCHVTASVSTNPESSYSSDRTRCTLARPHAIGPSTSRGRHLQVYPPGESSSLAGAARPGVVQRALKRRSTCIPVPRHVIVERGVSPHTRCPSFLAAVNADRSVS
ncbi:hypothetical protein DFH08DRAFT_954708 [Mycena albidolilacea]|uniref:Uncharacterized protein n=1 Tax=Mycena albidolilacea TaxID=1033008 RepID=A0AAD7EXS9_9AGAR|nr:hypothetical protein DFH08DRAFT_954708 [Mycena albidolilacea]